MYVFNLCMKIFYLSTVGIFTIKDHVQFWCEILIMKWGGSHLRFQLTSLLLTLRQNKFSTEVPVIFQCYVCLVEELFFSHCFCYRVKHKCCGRSSDMLPNFNK
jgi:hypothetical protein